MSARATTAFMRLALVALLLGCAALADAAERIVAFDQRLAIQADASLLVTEQLRVVAEGDQIKRGIFRDFPTDYHDRHGQRVRVGFEVLGVTRDGAREQWSSERLSNGVRVYVGARDRLVAPGTHTYVLRYRTTRQLGFFPEHDELYWNVTGNGWQMPIEATSADVTLPVAVPVVRLRLEGWTGAEGSTAREFEAVLREGGGTIRATRRLAAREGLTIALTFPKGVIAEPGTEQRLRWWASDNKGLVLVVATFFAVWCWYLWRWWFYGRDPAPGVVIPEYEAPEDLPPSVLRYVRDMRYDSSLFASDLMHLAERRYVRIARNKDFTVTKLRDADDRSDRIGRSLMAALFSTRDELKIADNEHAVIGDARSRHAAAVVASNEGRWFRSNGWSLAIGAVASVLAIAVGLVVQVDRSTAIVGGFCTVLVAIMAAAAIELWRRVWRLAGEQRIVIAVVASVAMAIGVVATVFLARAAGTAMFGVVAAFALTNALFAALLPAYTREGRRLRDRIEGFVTYLSVAEKEDLAREKAPPMTGERFAQFLPYAHALGVEAAWSGKLVAALGAVEAIAATRRSVDSWYQSNRKTDFSPTSFATELGSSFGSAISSASTPPGSSSGGGYSGGSSGSSGGGSGSSGGGGGGGGGGGW